MAGKVTSEKVDEVSPSGEIHETLFENDFVRVLKVDFEPGAGSAMHFHRSHLIFVIKPSEMRIVMPNGEVLSLRQKEGEVRWFEEGSYGEENVGTSPFQAIVTELK